MLHVIVIFDNDGDPITRGLFIADDATAEEGFIAALSLVNGWCLDDDVTIFINEVQVYPKER